ncbi:MAG TPA: hypothetical protein VFQ45_12900 [Longimicrobium sp.]|nr:hypothetical protein [Longimicrobium sp.]
MPSTARVHLLNLGVDALRLVAAPLLDRRCARCLVSEKRHPLTDGLCQACIAAGPPRPPEPATEKNLRELREAVAAALPGGPGSVPGPHDAIVLNSGGKDSLYMIVRLLRDFPGLRLLSVSYDNGFLNELSVRNIQAVCAARGVESLVVKPDPAIYRAIIGAGMRAAGTVGCYRVDSMDGAIFRDLASALAVERRIPLVFCGHTAAQTRTILGLDQCTMPPEMLARDRADYFGIPVADVFGGDDAHVWKGSRHDPARIPRWVFPHHAWRPSQAEIESFLAEAGFAPPRVKQYFTGNDLQAVFLLHDYRRMGWFSYEPEAAIMLRAGLVDRAEWRRIYALMEVVARSGRLTRRVAAPVLAKLGLDYEELFTPAELAASGRTR